MVNKIMEPNLITETRARGIQPWRLSPQVCAAADYQALLGSLAEGYEAVGLRDIEHAALLNRVDAKFVMPVGQLADVLEALQPSYQMLRVAGVRLNRYSTVYFDTSSFELYGAHVNHRPERYKVRSREYVDSGAAFLEVKHRTRKGRTEKVRISTPADARMLNKGMQDWLLEVCPLDPALLQPVLWNTFTRLTLVSMRSCERITLDVDIAYAGGGQSARLTGLAVAEVKMDANLPSSAFLRQMSAMKIRQHGFSKYAVGVSLMYQAVKKNAMKPTALWMKKIVGGAACYE